MLEVYQKKTLSLAEAEELAQYERQIREAMQRAFYEVGRCLMDIQGRKLYRENYTTFEDYCWRRWEMKRVQAYRLIQSAQVVENLQQRALCENGRPASPIGYTGQDISQAEDILPYNESQTRILAEFEPEAQAHIWQNVLEQTGGAGITTKLIEQVAQHSGFRRKAGTAIKQHGKKPPSTGSGGAEDANDPRPGFWCYVCNTPQFKPVFSADPQGDGHAGCCEPCAKAAIGFFQQLEIKLLKAAQKR